MSVKTLGPIEIEIDGMTAECNVCGGMIPDPVYWKELGETNNGYCSGSVRIDGFCGGFCELEVAYEACPEEEL